MSKNWIEISNACWFRWPVALCVATISWVFLSYLMMNFKAILQSCSNVKKCSVFGWMRIDGNVIPRYQLAAEKQGSLNHLSVTNEITNHLKSRVIEFMSKSDWTIWNKNDWNDSLSWMTRWRDSQNGNWQFDWKCDFSVTEHELRTPSITSFARSKTR